MSAGSVSADALTFLQARRLLAEFTGGPPLSLLLAMSGTALQLEMYTRAAAAQRGWSASVRTLPFNTLAQTVAMAPRDGEREVFLLMPWDFAPELDWRSGIPAVSVNAETIRAFAADVAGRLAVRGGGRVLYLPAPVPALFPDPSQLAALEYWLTSLACSLGASVIDRAAFSLADYLSTGCPVGSAWQGLVATQIVDVAVRADGPRKVLVTDLDNVVWAGGIAEDGVDGIAYGPEGVGFRHFIYQGFLRKLRSEGVLLAAVSRNDADVVTTPFRSGALLLKEESFVALLASYHAKSAQIRELATHLNLSLDAFVFVDDNPVELAEVSSALPDVRCVPFPPREDLLPGFLLELQALFARHVVTDEDRARTEMYRRRASGLAPADLGGADLTEFLRQLEMTLTLHDRSHGDRTRAVQLINKTNQFNLNGRRLEPGEVERLLAEGGRLYGASLTDRSGAHGEILACLLAPDGTIKSFVLSCRVFQRRVEHAFFAWLCDQSPPPVRLEFVGTARNEPIRQFLSDPAFSHTNGGVACDTVAFRRAHASALELLRLVVEHDLASEVRT